MILAARGWLMLLALACATRAVAVDCATTQARGHAYTTCHVDARRETLRLFHADERGKCFASFERIRNALPAATRKLAFAMNAGMFHADGRPVGLLVIDGRELVPLNRASAAGNFFLQPNGVFVVDADGPRVIASDEYRGLTPVLATQSGPMLVHRGQIPAIQAFSATSRSRHIRNGVCVRARVKWHS
ncbi:MAG TPA: phosphodiester glycosidase family protein [Steroidobacteraceae bacterium]